MINRPEYKNAVVAKKLMEHTLTIHAASESAAEWLEAEAPRFGRMYTGGQRNAPPYKWTLFVSDCFDVNEVKEWLETGWIGQVDENDENGGEEEVEDVSNG